MATHYKRRQELFEAVQFVRFNKKENQAEFDHLTEWITYALDNHLLSQEGPDLIWGYKKLDRRLKVGYWIIRSNITGMLEFKSDLDFQNQFEVHHVD